MANSIGWGQSTLNNNIGWGQGFINTNSWGIVYETSHAGETWIGYTENAVNYKNRVLLDSGTVEILKCIKL